MLIITSIFQVSTRIGSISLQDLADVLNADQASSENSTPCHPSICTLDVGFLLLQMSHLVMN